MKKPVFARALTAFLLLSGVAALHCGGSDSSTPPSGSGTGTTTTSTTGSTSGGTGGGSTGGAQTGTGTTSSGTQTTSTTTSGTAGTSGVGAGGAAGGNGIGGAGGILFDGSFGGCPATQPAQGSACPSPVAACQYGSVICACGNGQSFICIDLDGGFSFDGFSPRFDANFPRFDAGLRE